MGDNGLHNWTEAALAGLHTLSEDKRHTIREAFFFTAQAIFFGVFLL